MYEKLHHNKFLEQSYDSKVSIVSYKLAEGFP